MMHYIQIKQTMSLVGHSLGGAVALYMQSQYPDRPFNTTTCVAPIKSTTIPDNVDNKRFRNIGDPVSIKKGCKSCKTLFIIKVSINYY